MSLLDTGGPRQTVSAPRRRRQSGACSPRLALGPPAVEPHSHGLLAPEVVTSLCLQISVGTTKRAMKNVFTQTFGHFEDCGRRSAAAGSLIGQHPHHLRVRPPQPASPAEVEAENNIVRTDLTGDLSSLSLASCCSDHNSWFSSGLEVVLL